METADKQGGKIGGEEHFTRRIPEVEQEIPTETDSNQGAETIRQIVQKEIAKAFKPQEQRARTGNVPTAIRPNRTRTQSAGKMPHMLENARMEIKRMSRRYLPRTYRGL